MLIATKWGTRRAAWIIHKSVGTTHYFIYGNSGTQTKQTRMEIVLHNSEFIVMNFYWYMYLWVLMDCLCAVCETCYLSLNPGIAVLQAIMWVFCFFPHKGGNIARLPGSILHSAFFLSSGNPRDFVHVKWFSYFNPRSTAFGVDFQKF